MNDYSLIYDILTLPHTFVKDTTEIPDEVAFFCASYLHVIMIINLSTKQF